MLGAYACMLRVYVRVRVTRIRRGRNRVKGKQRIGRPASMTTIKNRASPGDNKAFVQVGCML
jgi:hypothetical protein